MVGAKRTLKKRGCQKIMIDFDKIEPIDLVNVQGGNGVIKCKAFDDGKCRIMKLTLKKGDSIGIHKHEETCEVVYVISGKAIFVSENKKEVLLPGQVNYCAKGHEHSVINEEDELLTVFCVIAKQ